VRSSRCVWQQRHCGDGRPKVTAELQRKRPGRPPGTSDTRDRILDSARNMFARNGIDKTSIRAIAKDAAVDPALVHHYFGTKTQLFAAAIHIPIDPMAVIGPLREVPVDQIGHVLPSILLPLWDSELGKGFIATLRSLLAGADVSLIRTFLQDVIVHEVGSRVDNPPGSGRIRVQFVASQLVGVVMARYILELEPFKSLPVEQIAETIAPNLQRYLTGELPGVT
jgi:AcrR family transcriptional regulator